MEYLLIPLIVVICYYINRRILRINLKTGNIYTWEMMVTNLIISIIIPLSIGFWFIVLINKLPRFKDTPPDWL